MNWVVILLSQRSSLDLSPRMKNLSSLSPTDYIEMGVRSLRLFRYPRLNQSYTERETARASLLSFSFSAATRRSGNRVKTSNNEMAFLSRPPGTRQAH